MFNPTKICPDCGEDKPHSEYYAKRRRDGSSKPQHRCKLCEKTRQASVYKSRPRDRAREREHELKQSEKRRRERADGSRPAFYVLGDARASDRKKGLGCDLTLDFVEQVISQPCSYCGTTESRMTLDRIDNSLGHLQANVVPSCYRCNMVRGNMPYEAWTHFVPAMRSAIAADAFGDWGTKPISRRT